MEENGFSPQLLKKGLIITHIKVNNIVTPFVNWLQQNELSKFSGNLYRRISLGKPEYYFVLIPTFKELTSENTKIWWKSQLRLLHNQLKSSHIYGVDLYYGTKKEMEILYGDIWGFRLLKNND